VMYVWFDALTFYISTLGWPEDTENFEKFWGTKEKPNAIQVAGKDNLRQQTAIWQVMLMSAGLPNSKQIFIHGFININGQKISKSQGDVVNPFEYVKKYGTDPVRYFLLAKINPYEDSDFSIEKFEASCNADLANGLGNLVARVAKLAEKGGYKTVTKVRLTASPKIGECLNDFRFDLAVEFIWNQIKELDTLINKEEPWKLDTNGLSNFLKGVVPKVLALAYELKPFLPDTAEKIQKQFSGPLVKSEASLFPRIK
jgi:methionyl-tRNA synthetase